MRDILGYEGLYGIDEYGDIYSVGMGKIIRCSRGIGGHKVVWLYKGGVGRRYMVHRLVVETFTKLEFGGDRVIVHLDGDVWNCRVGNLAVMSRSESQLRHVDHREVDSSYEEVAIARLKPVSVNGRRYDSIGMAVKMTGISRSMLYLVLNKKRKTDKFFAAYI